MPNQVERIDHAVVYCQYALDDAVARYRRLGFRLTPRGHHSMGSSNHLMIFDTDYVELLGVEPQNIERFADGWDHPVGLSGLVFKTDNAPALWDRLCSRNIPLAGDEPAVFHRPVELDSGERHNAHFRLVRLSLDHVPNGRVFFCEQQSPELVWRPEWQQHANGAHAILEYVYMLDEPQALAGFLDSVVGPNAMTPVSGGLKIRSGHADILFLEPAEVQRRFDVPTDGLALPGGRAVALTLATRSLQAVRDCLAKGDVSAFHETPDQRIVIAPEAAAGTILAFAEVG